VYTTRCRGCADGCQQKRCQRIRGRVCLALRGTEGARIGRGADKGRARLALIQTGAMPRILETVCWAGLQQSYTDSYADSLAVNRCTASIDGSSRLHLHRLGYSRATQTVVCWAGPVHDVCWTRRVLGWAWTVVRTGLATSIGWAWTVVCWAAPRESLHDDDDCHVPLHHDDDCHVPRPRASRPSAACASRITPRRRG
jgi:hypothetical protein